MGGCWIVKGETDDKVYDYLVEHPDGMLLNVIYKEMGLARMQVKFAVYRLVAQKKARLVPLGKTYILVKAIV